MREKSIADGGQNPSSQSVLVLNVIAGNLASTTVYQKCAVTVREDKCDNYECTCL